MAEVINSENFEKNWRNLAILNLVFAVAQAVAPFLSTITGIGKPIGENPEYDTLVTPAGYAFVIWAFIYPANIAYGVFQTFAGERENSLRRVSGYTLLAFVSCTLWAIAAQYLWLWLTVVLMIGILSGLVGAFAEIIKRGGKVSASEYGFVVLPLSVYTGWITVATVANASSFLKAAGFSNFILTDEGWAIVMLVVAGMIASFVTLKSRGSVPYALTVIWGLVGVIVANSYEQTNLSVAVAAGTSITIIVAVLFQSRTKNIRMNKD